MQEVQDLEERYEAWRAAGDARSEHRAKVTLAQAGERRPWDLDALVRPAEAGDAEPATPGRAGVRPAEGGGGEAVKPQEVWSALCLPLVQRLFAGCLDSATGTATVWDILLLLGPSRLPALCATFFMSPPPPPQTLKLFPRDTF